MNTLRQWESENRDFINNYIKRTSKNPSWGKISYGFEGVVNGVERKIIFTDYIDLTTYDLYKKKPSHAFKVCATCCSMIFARPLKTVIKTCYHLCFPISIPKEIYEAIREERSRAIKDPAYHNRNIFLVGTIAAMKSLADIIRTPLYGVALTIISIAGVLIYHIKPALLHDLRKIHGKVELSLCWGNKQRCLVMCFVPMENLMKVQRRNRAIEGITSCRIRAFSKLKIPFEGYPIDVTVYKEKTNPLIFGLTNWAHSQLMNKEKHQTINCNENYDKIIKTCCI